MTSSISHESKRHSKKATIMPYRCLGARASVVALINRDGRCRGGHGTGMLASRTLTRAGWDVDAARREGEMPKESTSDALAPCARSSCTSSRRVPRGAN